MDLVGTTGKVMKELGDVFGLPTGFLEQFASVNGFDRAERLGFVDQQVSQFPQTMAALCCRHCGPRTVVEGPVRRLHRPVSIICCCLRDHGPDFAGGRIDAFECSAITGANPFAINQHLVVFKISHCGLFPAQFFSLRVSVACGTTE